MSQDMHPAAAETIRAELAAIGTGRSRLQQRQRRVRMTSSLIAVAAVAIITSAAAIVAAGLPGSTTTSAFGEMTATATYTGPAVIDIGRAPEGANAVIVDITCMNDVGMVTAPTDEGDAGFHCRDNRGRTAHFLNGQLPAVGTTTISIGASPGTQWKATVQYASASTSDWAVNANGQTYGVENASGHPDLVPARADNGRKGWALFSQWYEAEKPETVNVYESDGTTVIGQAEVGVVLPEVPLDRRYIDDLDSLETATPTSRPAP